MTLAQLQDYVFHTKYARFRADLGRRETYPEAVSRVMAMHRRRYAGKGIDAELDEAEAAMRQRLVLGSQRALQFGGAPIERKHARLYNCTVSFCDRPRFFSEALWLLLCGCGVGFSVQRHHVARLPALTPPTREIVWRVPDTIEGWADALGALVSGYLDARSAPLPELAGARVRFDFSAIRPAGSALRSGGGKAPGPKPLARSLELARAILDARVASGGRLRPIDCYDIVMHASDAVLSGGVRRSATICLFSPDDHEMATAKTGDWFAKNPQRGRSNNSALLLRSATTKDDFLALMRHVREFGEPGFVWSDSTELMVNPCFHRDTRIATSRGLLRIGDLFLEGGANEVVVDARIAKGDGLRPTALRTEVRPASAVRLTQRSAELYEVSTAHGHRVVATANHQFPTSRGRLPLSDLRRGDTLLLQCDEGRFGSAGTFDQGLILGLITGDGVFSRKARGTRTIDEAFIDVWSADFGACDDIAKAVEAQLMHVETRGNGGRAYALPAFQAQTVAATTVAKRRIGGIRLYRLLRDHLGIEDPRAVKRRVPEAVWRGSRDLVVGYLQGLFCCDGSIQGHGRGRRGSLNLRLNQSNRALLEDVQVLLQNFGVCSRIYLRRSAGTTYLPDGRGHVRAYPTKDNFDLVVNRPNLIRLIDRIGLFGRQAETAKQRLQERGYDCFKPERYRTRVVDIRPLGRDDVFCLHEPVANTVIANGVCAGNCAEIGMWPVDAATGLTGWHFCNLCEINMKACAAPELLARAARAAAILGTVQAGYDEFPYLGATTEAIVRREALLGCSMTGMMDNPSLAFDPELQRRMAALILEVNAQVAAKLGINPAARATCVKPAGTTSSILGTASGIHAHHARRYFRRVQANVEEATLKFFASRNPRAVERSVWNPNRTDAVITFCVEVPPGARTANEVGALELLRHVELTQRNWVAAGRRAERCTQPWLTHNVSNTITVLDDEWDAVADEIYEHRDAFCGVSLLPAGGDLDYPQAPFTAVLTPEEIVRRHGVGALLASGLIVDGERAFGGDLWAACAAALEIGEDLGPAGNGDAALAAKRDWVRRAQQFAARYFAGDAREMTHCLKRVHDAKRWEDLQREDAPVDWTLMRETSDATGRVELDPACIGGHCAI